MAREILDKRKANYRQLNIELLRIFSMLMVLVIHYNVGTNGQTTHEMVVTEPIKAIGIASLKSLSFICVNCFIIISGYFGIKWKCKGFCNYLFQISFWGGYDSTHAWQYVHVPD